jgi:uncharacterized membrane protein YtjA (UPF0391 family)
MGDGSGNRHDPTRTPGKGLLMLRWAAIFFIIAIIAAIFGFGNIAAGATDIAKILFFIFVVLLVLSLLVNLVRGKPVR